MAKVPVEVVKTLKPNELSGDFDFKSAAANDEIHVPFKGKDHQTVFIVTATAACNLTVKAGNGLQGVADEVLAVKAGKHHVFTLESGRFKNVYGSNVGEVIIVPSAACSIAVAEVRA